MISKGLPALYYCLIILNSSFKLINFTNRFILNLLQTHLWLLNFFSSFTFQVQKDRSIIILLFTIMFFLLLTTRAKSKSYLWEHFKKFILNTVWIFFLIKVTFKSPASEAGLRKGDVLLGIGQKSTMNPPMSHQQASELIKNSGNNLDLTVRRNPLKGEKFFFCV